MGTRRVGIVGAAGQVGIAALKSISDDSRFAAIGICRNSVSAARVACQGLDVRVVQTDDAAQLSKATADLDVLVNCALPQYQPAKTAIANRRLAEALTVAAAGKDLVHLSSVAVYGNFLSGDSRLFLKPNPDSGYGQQKVHMERLLQSLAPHSSARCTILRVGHVYGPELRWSETFFDLVKDDEFRLPFDGELQSNAISIRNLIAAIRYIASGNAVDPVLNLLDSPQTTWRQVFDLHSQASNVSPAKWLDPHESELQFRQQKMLSKTGMTTRLFLESWAWLKHLPASYVAAAPTFKALIQRVVGHLASERLEAKLWAIQSKHLSKGDTSFSPPILPVLLSESVPGPNLKYEGNELSEMLPQLRLWHDTISSPLALSELRVMGAG